MEMREVLAELVAAQVEHPVIPKIRVSTRRDDGALMVWHEEAKAWMPTSVEFLQQLFESRANAIYLEGEDPYFHGHEPEFWAEVDWTVCRMRAACPGQVLEIYVLGGNRAAKTEFCAKRMMQQVVENPKWLAWCLHSDESSSRSIQQKRIWRYMPKSLKPEDGKYKKGLSAKLNYNELTGFTENAFALHNRSQMRFKFYSADVKAVEGDELDCAWSDELIPMDWVNAIKFRLLTKAGRTHGTAEECKLALARREAGQIERVPEELLKKLYQGVHVISFTPVLGFTPTVAAALQGVKTVKEEEAEILPKLGRDGEVLGYEKVPRVQLSESGDRSVVYFHTKDNAYGGNWAGMKATLADKPRNFKLERAYGVATKAFGAQFPKLKREVHVRPVDRLPKSGTWYHVVDPCHGRNFFMQWIKVNALGEAFVVREWPQVLDAVPGHGSLGPWAELGTGNRKDGDRGPAQQTLGWGVLNYKREFARIERELYLLDCRVNGVQPKPDGRIVIKPGCRIIDARAGNTESLANEAAKTMIEHFEENHSSKDPDGGPVYFVSAGRDAGGEGVGRGSIREGVTLVNDALDYDELKSYLTPSGEMCFDGASPKLFIAANCENTIFALENWTGLDGDKGACKDPVDVLRYFVMCGPEDVANIATFTDLVWG